MPVTENERTITKGKPHHVSSMPESRFMPKMLAMSVGNMRIIDTEVICFITLAMLLLMMLA